MDKKGSWRPQEAEKVPKETFLDDLGPKLEIKRGPTSTLGATKISQKTPQREVAFSSGGVLRGFKTRVDALR
jgi:hypothetical protein